jgi:phenylalanyl-tRNA synthetase beta chain
MMPAFGGRSAEQWQLRNRIQQIMAGFGFSEAINYSFVHKANADHLRLSENDYRRANIALLNPLSEDQSVMRTSMVPGLLSTLQHNLAQQVKDLKLFEVGKVFIADTSAQLPREIEMLAALWSGARTEKSWHAQDAFCDYYDIKGIVEGLMHALKVQGVGYTRLPEEIGPYTRAGYAAQISIADQRLGVVAEVHPQVLSTFDIKQPVYIFELDLDRLAASIPQAEQARPLPKFPSISRDSTIIVDEGIEAQQVMAAVEDMHEPLVEKVQLFDVFHGGRLDPGKKSLSIRLTYRSAHKTLVDADVSDLHKTITERLVKIFEATLPA